MEIQPHASYEHIRVGDILKYSPYGIKRMECLGFLPVPGHPNRQRILKAIMAFRVRACEDCCANSTGIKCITITDPYHWYDEASLGETSWQPRLLMIAEVATATTQTRRLSVKARDG